MEGIWLRLEEIRIQILNTYEPDAHSSFLAVLGLPHRTVIKLTEENNVCEGIPCEL